MQYILLRHWHVKKNKTKGKNPANIRNLLRRHGREWSQNSWTLRSFYQKNMAEGGEIEVYRPQDIQSRLKEEQETLDGYFWPEKFPILYINNQPCFEHTVILKNERTYKLRVYINDDYPDPLPILVVCESPEPMPVGQPHWSGSHNTHTYPPVDGFLRICHWHWAAWKRENMIFQVSFSRKTVQFRHYLVT